MRNMSFMLTVEQMRNGTKTVTRRKGWLHLKQGDLVQACEKCMGLKKGEKIKRISVIRIVSVRRECLGLITADDVCREGFPGWTPERFIELYCSANGGDSTQATTRIEFEQIQK